MEFILFFLPPQKNERNPALIALRRPPKKTFWQKVKLAIQALKEIGYGKERNYRSRAVLKRTIGMIVKCSVK